MKKLMMTCAASAALFLAPGGLATAYADAPAAPDLTIQAYVNGAINIGIWQWQEPYQNAVGNGGYFTPSSTKLSGITYEFQMKGPNDAEFTDVSPSATTTFDIANRCFYCWALDTNYVGSATVRVRAKNGDGEVSDWVESEPLAATVRVTGTLICSDGTDTGDYSAKNAFDGRIATLVDEWSNDGKKRYTGYLFDKPTRIKGIRYMARLDHTFWYTRTRFQGSCFQIASDATFSDATTVHTVADDYVDLTRMTEVTFDEPVTCTAIRHYKEAASGEQSAEIEYIPADPPYVPAATVAASDLTNFYPVVTWTMPEGVWSACALEVATQAAGPFTTVAGTAHVPADGATFTYTNTVALVGVPLYYRVTATCSHPNFKDATFTSSTLAFTRSRRLDRNWGAETALLDGVTVLPDTNGVMQTELKDHTLCFDGDTSTFVDQGSSSPIRPVIGLKFASPAHVVGFGYICRNDNWCHERIKNARLYAANDTPELLDRVVVSGNPTQSSQDTTFYYKACDTVLGTGALCYFLYRDEGAKFNGNVAEVMFFGWTDADVEAAGTVTAPAEVTFARDGAGLALTWSRGGNATGYRVERRVRGTDDWTTVGTTGADARTLTDATVATAVYEYRVVTLGVGGAEATSETFTYRFYVPGNGTGLSGVVMWPYGENSARPTQRANEVARGPEAVNLALAADAPLGEGVTDAVAHLAWEGKIVAPFDGAYTFTLDTDAGGAVFIDRSTVVNSWRGGATSASGATTLSAGEHRIRIDYRTNENGAERKCVLRWSGPVEDEIVPASQLLPAETPPSAKVGGFTVQVYGQSTASLVYENGSGIYAINGAKDELTTLDQGLNATALLKPWSGRFDCSFDAYPTSNGRSGVIFQNADGAYIICYVMKHDLYNWYGVVRVDPATGASTDVVQRTCVSSTDSNLQYDARMVRNGRSFTFYYRPHGTEEWTEIGSWTDTDKIFDRAGYIGVAAWGYNQATTFVTTTARNFAVKVLSSSLVFILR